MDLNVLKSYLNMLKKNIKTDVDEFKKLAKNFSYYRFPV